MYNDLSIYCTNIGQYIKVAGGESLLDIYKRLEDKINITPVCARVNNKTEDLGFPVFSPKQVEFLDANSPSGNRVYIRSLCMVLYKAIADTMPGLRLRIEHSISNGYYCLLLKDGEIRIPTHETVKTIKNRMHEIVKQDIPFIRKEKLTEDVIKTFQEEGLDDKVNLLKYSEDLYSIYYTLDNVSDSYYGNLAPTTGILNVFDLLPFKKGLLLLGPSKTDSKVPSKPIRQEKMYKAFTEHLDFNHIIGINDAGA